MIKLVAFDWNGTLLADSKLAAEGDSHTFQIFSNKPVTILQMRKHFAIPIIKYWVALGFDEKAFMKNYELINQTFHEYYEARVNRCRTRAGVKQALGWLKKNSIASIIYSNHTVNDIIRQLDRLQIHKYLKTVLARNNEDRSHMHSRGKEQKLLSYVKSLKLQPHEVISVGDTEEEIEIGKKYGYYTVGITGGYSTTARLKKHRPDFLIHNMLELKKIVQRLNT